MLIAAQSAVSGRLATVHTPPTQGVCIGAAQTEGGREAGSIGGRLHPPQAPCVPRLSHVQSMRPANTRTAPAAAQATCPVSRLTGAAGLLAPIRVVPRLATRVGTLGPSATLLSRARTVVQLVLLPPPRVTHGRPFTSRPSDVRESTPMGRRTTQRRV